MNGKSTYSSIKFDALINSKMSFKCPICARTFSQRTAYSQHVQKCLKKAEVEDDVEMDTKSDQYNDDENDDENEVQNMSFDSIESSQSNLVSEISTMSLEDSFEDILESSEEAEIFEEFGNPEPKIFEEFENPEPETCSKFLNDAYKVDASTVFQIVA